MRLSRRRFCYAAGGVYCVFSLYAAYVVFYGARQSASTLRPHASPGDRHIAGRAGQVDAVVGKGVDEVEEEDDGTEWNPWGQEFEKEPPYKPRPRPGPEDDSTWIVKVPGAAPGAPQATIILPPGLRRVHIWGKAAIGMYLWEHVFGGELVTMDSSGQWQEGAMTIKDMYFRFRTGPMLVPEQVPLEGAEAVMLVLNGREENKVAFARPWLKWAQQLVEQGRIRGAGLVLLGNERCDNDWLVPLLRGAGGFLEPTFLVYDSPLVDGSSVLQWPLGVATYRGFPVVKPSEVSLDEPRRYACNFLGTVYPGSSRVAMLRALHESGFGDSCLVVEREQWQPMETSESRGRYMDALRQSDLTLCPVGVNTECYRIYEASALGSVPVVEDVLTPGHCGNSTANGGRWTRHAAPLRLLKAAGAPFVFVRNWSELPGVLRREAAMSARDKAERRVRLVRWYESFRAEMRDSFVGAVRKSYFGDRMS
ncbi:ribitol-5-phosphate xylosyltransferase 1 [Lethenteron reissneri]|uniref:ribitol-5-phosphate xylosyltransferase 1 n=1 Tax=Lethenteron reissneri TaxID=7753 RepID=UPI002AB6261B|nr:ribitol-5-phosphate xylosyltransferase 1 [Lethenteron reissneri]